VFDSERCLDISVLHEMFAKVKQWNIRKEHTKRRNLYKFARNINIIKNLQITLLIIQNHKS